MHKKMNILRRKSGTGGGSRRGLTESGLLHDVQDCCSKANQKGKDPDEACMSKAVARLMETTDTEEFEMVIKYLGNELKNEVHQVVMLALATTGYLMRSDCPSFQRSLSKSPHILKPMGVLIEYQRKAGARTEQYEQANRALALIQSWAETLGGANGTIEILEMYRSLKKKEWVRWPPRVHGYDPVNGPMYSRSEVSVDPDAPAPPRKPASLRPSSLRTFSSEETNWLRKDFDQFDQMLGTLEEEINRCKDSRDIEQNALIPELVAQCSKIGPQLRSMIEIVSATNGDDPDSLTPLLEMNDRLLKLIEKHAVLSSTQPSVTRRTEEDYTPFSGIDWSQPKQEEPYNPFEDREVMSQVFGANYHTVMSAASNPPMSAGYGSPMAPTYSSPMVPSYSPQSDPWSQQQAGLAPIVRPPERQAPTSFLRSAAQAQAPPLKQPASHPFDDDDLL